MINCEFFYLKKRMRIFLKLLACLYVNVNMKTNLICFDRALAARMMALSPLKSLNKNFKN